MGRDHRHAGCGEIMSRRIAALKVLRSARHVRDFGHTAEARRLGWAVINGAVAMLREMDVDFDPKAIAQSPPAQRLRELVLS